MTHLVIRRLALSLSVGVFVCGCTSQPGEPAAQPSQIDGSHAEHEHPSAGPHGGELIELGNEQYHAEIVHDANVTVYLLDGAAKAAVAVPDAAPVVNISHDGNAEQFKLAASPLPEDPAGASSRFVSDDVELLTDLKEGHAEAQFVFTIEGTQYRGELHHEHDEEGHQH